MAKPLWNGFSYFPHQLSGIEWMLEKERIGTEVSLRNKEGTALIKGGFQCDDMGLGKTIQMTAVMVNHVVKKTLLIAPLAMIDTWATICKRAGMSVYEVDKKKKDKWLLQNMNSAIPMRLMKNRPAVYISNYEKLYTTTSLFREPWDRVVLDEAHKIRNGDGMVAYFARKLKAPLRWVITGTPLVNSLKDVVSLLAFLGVSTSAMYSWEKRYDIILPKILIHRSLDSLRTTIQGAPPLPEIHQQFLPFTTAAEEEFYHGVQCASESMALKYASDRISPSQAFLLLLRLRQISVHPQVYINSKRRQDFHYARPDWIGPSTKLEAVKSILTNDTDQLHKYIIFCQFNDEMVLIREYLLQEKLLKDENILIYNGQMNQEERRVVLETSKATQEKTVLLIQLQAGGVGLNLQEYDRVLFVSPWWTSAMMDQAIARAVRMGQTKVVKVYHLHLKAEQENTINIDAIINAKAEEKRIMLEKLFALCESK
jgi:SNF2 family DNA or RNA helicase